MELIHCICGFQSSCNSKTKVTANLQSKVYYIVLCVLHCKNVICFIFVFHIIVDGGFHRFTLFMLYMGEIPNKNG